MFWRFVHFSCLPQCPTPKTLGSRHRRAKRTRSNRSPTRRNGSQPRELGRQCDLSCRSGAGGGHGSRLLFPRTRCRAMGGNSGRIAGDSFRRLNDRFLNTVAFIFVFQPFSFDWIPDASRRQIAARVIDAGSRWRCEIPAAIGRSAQSLAERCAHKIWSRGRHGTDRNCLCMSSRKIRPGPFILISDTVRV